MAGGAEPGQAAGRAIARTRAQVTVEVYGRRYLKRHRVNLAENTVELYEHLFSKHIVAGLGAMAVGELTREQVETWFGELKARVPSTAAKAYRLLRQIMNTALEDRLRTEQDRILVTRNSRDFAPLLREGSEAGRHHAGCILIWTLYHYEVAAIITGVTRLVVDRRDLEHWRDLSMAL